MSNRLMEEAPPCPQQLPEDADPSTLRERWSWKGDNGTMTMEKRRLPFRRIDANGLKHRLVMNGLELRIDQNVSLGNQCD